VRGGVAYFHRSISQTTFHRSEAARTARSRNGFRTAPSSCRKFVALRFGWPRCRTCRR
jgi:hypothetical protein